MGPFSKMQKMEENATNFTNNCPVHKESIDFCKGVSLELTDDDLNG